MERFQTVKHPSLNTGDLFPSVCLTVEPTLLYSWHGIRPFTWHVHKAGDFHREACAPSLPRHGASGASRGRGETQSCRSGSPACRQGPEINQPCMVTLVGCCVLAWGCRCLPCWGSTALTDFCGLASPRASQLLQHLAPCSPGHLSYQCAQLYRAQFLLGSPWTVRAQCPLAPSPDLGPSRLCFCPLLSPACIFLVSALGTRPGVPSHHQLPTHRFWVLE